MGREGKRRGSVRSGVGRKGREEEIQCGEGEKGGKRLSVGREGKRRCRY